MSWERKAAAVHMIIVSFLSTTAFAVTLEVPGSTTVQTRILEPGASALKAKTGIEVKMLPTGSGKGLLQLAEGKATVSAASEVLEEVIASAKKAAAETQKTVSMPNDLMFHELASDEVVFIVNKDNPVSSLTKAQLKDLHTGKIANWKEVGGADMPVKVISGAPGSATRAVFQKQIMDGADYAKSMVEMRATPAEIGEVARDKGAIGVVSVAFAEAGANKVKTVKGPGLSRPLALVTVGKPTADVQMLIDFFRSAEGKKLMK